MTQKTFEDFSHLNAIIKPQILLSHFQLESFKGDSGAQIFGVVFDLYEIYLRNATVFEYLNIFVNFLTLISNLFRMEIVRF